MKAVIFCLKRCYMADAYTSSAVEESEFSARPGNTILLPLDHMVTGQANAGGTLADASFSLPLGNQLTLRTLVTSYWSGETCVPPNSMATRSSGRRDFTLRSREPSQPPTKPTELPATVSAATSLQSMSTLVVYKHDRRSSNPWHRCTGGFPPP